MHIGTNGFGSTGAWTAVSHTAGGSADGGGVVVERAVPVLRPVVTMLDVLCRCRQTCARRAPRPKTPAAGLPLSPSSNKAVPGERGAVHGYLYMYMHAPPVPRGAASLYLALHARGVGWIHRGVRVDHGLGALAETMIPHPACPRSCRARCIVVAQAPGGQREEPQRQPRNRTTAAA